jgi:ComF family protein
VVLSDLLLFFVPAVCLVCGKKLPVPAGVLCLECESGLPRTSFRDPVHNPVCQAFWGRVPVEMAISLLRFEKGSAYQALIHDLKYRGNRMAGRYLGLLLGKEILLSGLPACDILVPVPLHRKRRRERGYNQSEIIAGGVSRITGTPVVNNLLMRSVHRSSQTSMGRYERYRNVSRNFRICPHAPDANGLKILLVDDVITTGATLEACCMELLDYFCCRIFVATVSCA